MSHVECVFSDGCARITLADPEHGNPVHRESVGELFDAVRSARRDGARVIVLAAQGRFFSVGGDLGAFARSADVADYIDDLADALHRVVSELVRAEAIVVSVVQGHVAGAGFPLAAAADIVVAAESARFSLGYTKVGLNIDGGASMLTHTLGLHRMLRVALLNDTLTAQEAHAAGLIARVVPDADLAKTSEELVAQLLRGPVGALASTKRLLRAAVEPDPESVMRREALAIRLNAATPDGREGVTAFLEKRPPMFE
ncbi:enoyl-CoA hydratase [Actinocorallia herbida]|uniref:Enoyl-CoA hydratase n=1 Tax=Actinocorallia herbida TaxID=58109 RepID=A0A3N1D2Y2_9ACTN|nr:enoyl-CoA hydratase-related protein [Actinocorallia herbida]ROO87893.1 enoyl-CoA hydratase [Actinocorallia herbida]